MTITFTDILKASERIKGQAVLTPMLEYQVLNDQVDGRVLIKPECLQRTGSFKFRGAFNRLSQFTEQEKTAGVVAWSSGNHAQGIAAAAKILGIQATIVMPADTPMIKVEKTKSYGAEVISYDRYTESREDIGRQISHDRGAIIVPPYEDEGIIAGQGTTGLELAGQVADVGGKLDQLLTCCGGGGLTSGISIAFAELSPSTYIYSVEPKDFDDTARSLAAGKRLKNDPAARSICDALMASEPGEMTFAINREYLSGGLSVSDDEVREAMRFAYNNLKLIIEPGGAVTLAAVLSGKIDAKDKTTGIIVSGGNVDPALFVDVISS